MSPSDRLLAHRLLAGAVLAMAAASAQAGSIAITNPSFETAPVGGFNLTAGCGAVLGCQYNSGSIPGWTVTGPTGEWQPGNSTTAFFDTTGGESGPTVGYTNGGTIDQTLAATTVAGDTYTLTFFEGWRNDQALPDSVVDLVIGGTTDIAATGAALTQGAWTEYQATFTAPTSGQSIGIDISNPGGGQGDFDNFSLSASVPEPAEWALLLTGFGAVGFALRRRRMAVA